MLKNRDYGLLWRHKREHENYNNKRLDLCDNAATDYFRTLLYLRTRRSFALNVVTFTRLASSGVNCRGKIVFWTRAIAESSWFSIRILISGMLIVRNIGRVLTYNLK